MWLPSIHLRPFLVENAFFLPHWSPGKCRQLRWHRRYRYFAAHSVYLNADVENDPAVVKTMKIRTLVGITIQADHFKNLWYLWYVTRKLAILSKYSPVACCFRYKKRYCVLLMYWPWCKSNQLILLTRAGEGKVSYVIVCPLVATHSKYLHSSWRRHNSGTETTIRVGFISS